MIRTQTKMTMFHFHDFYFLQALQAGVMAEISRNPAAQFQHSVEKLQLDIQRTIDDIVPNIALRTFVYLYAACLGEARHARSDSAHRSFLPGTRKSHRHELFAQITNYAPTKQNLNALIEIYSQEWHSG